MEQASSSAPADAGRDVGGNFKDVSAPELGSHAIRAALERAQVSPEEVEEVLLVARRDAP
jgi:acetyl-CoA acetyltransferase